MSFGQGRLGLFGEIDHQDALIKGGADFLGLHIIDDKLSEEGTGFSLPDDIFITLLAFVAFLGLFSLDGQDVVLIVNLDVFLA